MENYHMAFHRLLQRCLSGVTKLKLGQHRVEGIELVEIAMTADPRAWATIRDTAGSSLMPCSVPAGSALAATPSSKPDTVGGEL